MAKISIVTGAHLCRNPRVVKEATALGEAGHAVTVLGPATDDDLAAEDATLATAGGFEHRFVADLRAGAPGRSRHRLLRRVATEAVQRLGLQRPESLGYGVRPLLAAARDERADLVIGHQELGTYVAARLLGEGRRVGVDIEDWHSEDQVQSQAKRPRRLLRDCEATLMQRAAHTTTTSHALADALATRYDAPPPVVVYNAFPWADRQALDGQTVDRAESGTERPSLHWVSQTIGTDRGLVPLCDALALVERPVDLHLRGHVSADDRAWLAERFPAGRGHRLFLHGLVPHTELLSRIAEHDIGLALEEREPPSRNLTVTNKILHYLLAGLAVVATDTAGQVEVAAQVPAAVALCRNGDAAGLAAALNALLAAPERLAEAKAAALNAAAAYYSWEQQAPTLLQSVEHALAA